MSVLRLSDMAVASTLLQSIHWMIGNNISMPIRGSLLEAQKDYINSLPPETVCEILQLVVFLAKEPTPKTPETTRPTLCHSTDNPTTPFFLTQICRRWRYIAQNCRRLWGSIAITSPRMHHVYLVKLWMAYAGGYPMDIYLRQSLRPTETEEEMTLGIICLLAERGHNWSTIEFHFCQDYLPRPLVHHLNGLRNCPSAVLKKVTINQKNRLAPPGLSDQSIMSTWHSLNEIQSLASLRWISSDWISNLSNSQLRSLSVDGVGLSIEDLIQGVKLCLNLEDLDVRIHSEHIFPDNKIQSINPISHNRLRHVRIKGITGNIKAFLCAFSFPDLFSVDLSSVDVSTCSTLWQLITRSDCTLRELALVVLHGNWDQALVEWFKLDFLQSLEAMDISGIEITNTALSMLNRPALHGNRPSYFDKLEHVSLDCHRDIDHDLFLRMLGSRFFTTLYQSSRSELLTASFFVHDKTNDLTMYEDMINLLGKGKAVVKGDLPPRKLIIEQV